MIYLKPCLYCLLADFICSLARADQTTQLKLWAGECRASFCEMFLDSLPHLLVLEYKARVETGHGTEAFQELSWLSSTNDVHSLWYLFQKDPCDTEETVSVYET